MTEAEGRKFSKQRAAFRASVLHDAALSLAARVVGYEIADHVNARSGDAWPSQEWLSKRLGINVRTVRRATADLVKAGWFTAEIDGRAWRYVPNRVRWENGGRKPDKLSGIETGHSCSEGGQIVPPTPDNLGPLSSLSTQIDREPHAAPRHSSDASASGLQRLIDEERGVKQHILSDAAITTLAKKQGAPTFVFENSEPWKAWLDYRKRNGLPASLPCRQHMIGGRARSGWHMPTLWPPGYGPQEQSA